MLLKTYLVGAGPCAARPSGTVLVGVTGVRSEMISGPLRDTELLALCHRTASTAHSVGYCPTSTIVAETCCLIVARCSTSYCLGLGPSLNHHVDNFGASCNTRCASGNWPKGIPEAAAKEEASGVMIFRPFYQPGMRWLV